MPNLGWALISKKKSNQASYLVSIHLIFPLSYALFMSWINETVQLA